MVHYIQTSKTKNKNNKYKANKVCAIERLTHDVYYVHAFTVLFPSVYLQDTQRERRRGLY